MCLGDNVLNALDRSTEKSRERRSLIDPSSGCVGGARHPIGSRCRTPHPRTVRRQRVSPDRSMLKSGTVGRAFFPREPTLPLSLQSVQNCFSPRASLGVSTFGSLLEFSLHAMIEAAVPSDGVL